VKNTLDPLYREVLRTAPHDHVINDIVKKIEANATERDIGQLAARLSRYSGRLKQPASTSFDGEPGVKLKAKAQMLGSRPGA
jgi:hypothetical protein